METMKQWEKTEEEGGALRGRLLAQQRSTDANDATTGDFIFSSETSSEEEESLNQKEGGTQSGSYEISRFNRAHVDVSFQMSAVTSHHDEGDIAKGEELPGFGSSPSMQSIDQIEHYNSFNNGATDHGNGIAKTREKGQQEASELYLERVYQKPAAHDFYCPHCNTCITKVIIRGQELEITPPAVESAPPKPVDPIRCTSCFSFLIPAANWFSPKLVPKDEDSHIEQGTNIQDQHSQTALPSKDHVSNDFAGAKPTTPAQSVGVGFEVPSHDLNETLYGQKPTMSAPSVGVEFSVPSHDLNVTIYGPKPTLSAQSDGVTAETNPSGNNSESSIGVQVPESTTVIIMQPDPATITEQGDTKSLEILKSIVYGGLTEAITSLSIVTSAASADTATLNIIALALANLFGGVFVIGHKLWELKSDQSRVPSSETGEQVARYQKVLGKRENFFLHASVAILSFLVFGLVPPLVYGFSFRQSNNRDLKIAAVASASLLCIIALAVGKAYTHKPPKYIKTLLYYIAIGIGVGGVSYLAGVLIDKLIEKLGWFASNASGTLFLPKLGVVKPALETC